MPHSVGRTSRWISRILRKKLDESEALNLASALIYLQACFDRWLESRRWQLGNNVGRAVDFVLRRPRLEPAADYIRDVLAAFAQWKADVVAGRRSPSAAAKDVPELAGWIESLDHAFEATVRSRRLGFGNVIGGLYDRTPWGAREPFVTEEIRRIFLAVRQLRLDGATGPSTYATQFGRMLACMVDARFSRDPRSDHLRHTIRQNARLHRRRSIFRWLRAVGRQRGTPRGNGRKDKQGRKSRPLVSVIMPTYDRATVIGQAIRSVVEQDYPEWELFVCDDGSQDDTENVVQAICRSAHPLPETTEAWRGSRAQCRHGAGPRHRFRLSR